jgi:hypothetical protein
MFLSQLIAASTLELKVGYVEYYIGSAAFQPVI